jgi:hypothetical protein
MCRMGSASASVVALGPEGGVWQVCEMFVQRSYSRFDNRDIQ